MSDGPQSPDTSSTPRGFGLSRLFRRGQESSPKPPPREASVEQPRAESPFAAVMRQLHEKNEQLGGFLVNEFGEGDSAFMILKYPLYYADRTKYGGIKNDSGAKIATTDFLIATSRGFVILSARAGEYKHDPQFPQYETVLVRRPEDDAGVSAVNYSTLRGSIDIRPQFSGARESEKAQMDKSGSSYSVGQSYGGEDVHNLNFGAERYLEFKPRYNDPASTYLTRISPGLKSDILAQIQSGPNRNNPKQVLGDIESRGVISLIVQPDSNEVSEIMRQGLSQARESYEKAQQELAEASAQPQPTLEASIPQDQQPDLKTQQEAAQRQTAESVLDLLNNS